MHEAAYRFVAAVVESERLSRLRVLEIGSYNVNGSIRPLFADSTHYVGIDRRPGRDVDIVAEASEFDGAGEFDVAISMEAMEHTPRPRDILECAGRAIKRGGILILTCASPVRAPHACNGGPVVPPNEHYRGIDPNDLLTEMREMGWKEVQVSHNSTAGDLYAKARKWGDAV